jgi:hypothetical protein
MGGLYFYECPVGWLSLETNIIMQQLTHEEKPPRIYSGTWGDQPQWYIEAIQIYNKIKTEWLLKQKV